MKTLHQRVIYLGMSLLSTSSSFFASSFFQVMERIFFHNVDSLSFPVSATTLGNKFVGFFGLMGGLDSMFSSLRLCTSLSTSRFDIFCLYPRTQVIIISSGQISFFCFKLSISLFTRLKKVDKTYHFTAHCG